jgi:hypothetical protein
MLTAKLPAILLSMLQKKETILEKIADLHVESTPS